MLTGRAQELTDLTRAMEQAAAGRGGLVLIGGEAGIGKTALLEAAIANASPLLPVSGHTAGPGETPLLGPWREVAAELQLQLGCSAAPLPAPFGGAPAAASPLDLALALAAWLGSVGRPLLLAFEDLHGADQPTLDLLRLIAPRLGRKPVLVVATYRSEAVGPGHPFWEMLPDLQRAGAHTLALERLGEEAVAELAAAVLPAVPGLPGVARYIHQRTGGHPLFVRELLAWYNRTGSLPAPEGPLPDTVQQALDRRLERVSAPALAVLQAAAVIGERFSYGLLEQTANVADLLAALDEAIRMRIIKAEGGGERFAFDHALVRDALVARLLGPRRRQVHARVAEALLAQTAPPDPDSVAFHLERAGDPRATRWLMAAGDQSYRLGARPAARERYERALALLPPQAPERAELLLKLGHTRASSETLWAEAKDLAEQAGDRAVAVWCRHALANRRQEEGNPASLHDLAAVQAEQESLLSHSRYQQLEATLYGQAGGYPRAGSARAWALAKAGRPAEARALIGALYEQAHPTARRTDLLQTEYWITGMYGRLADALEIGARVVDEALRHGDARTALSVEGNRLYQILLCRADQPDAVDAVAARVTDLLTRASQQAGYNLASEGLPPLGWYAFLRGDWEGAQQHLIGYLHRRPENEDPGVRSLAVQVCLARGDAATARALLAGIPPHHPDDPAGLHSMQVAAYTTRASIALAEGDLPLARAWLDAGDRMMAARKQPGFRSALRLGWARWHEQAGHRDEALAAATEALALAEERREFRFLIMTNLALGEIAAKAGQAAAATQPLNTARTIAAQCRFPYYVARAEEALARLRPAKPGPLTGRELEIVRLVAAGLSDKEVAAQLHISPRTVDAHLRNIFVKVDVTNRTALGALALRQGW